MTTFVMYAAAIISVAIVIFMLIKKMDIKITLFLMGIVLMFDSKCSTTKAKKTMLTRNILRPNHQ